MVKKYSDISGYIAWFLQQYQELGKNSQPTTQYRLVETKKKSNGEYQLSFQLIGKAVIFKSSPEEILANEKAIEYFSSKDIHTITQLVCQREQESKLKIVSKQFSEKLNTLIFKIKSSSNGEINEKTALNLSKDYNIIKNLSPEDAHAIGYAAAKEADNLEKKLITELRDTTQEQHQHGQ